MFEALKHAGLKLMHDAHTGIQTVKMSKIPNCRFVFYTVLINISKFMQFTMHQDVCMYLGVC